MELNFLVTLVSILTLLVAQTSLLDPGPQVDKFVNLENDPAMKHPYLQRYTLISTYIPTLKGKNRTIRSKRHSLVTGTECHHLSIVINATKHTFCIFEERLVENDVAKRDTKIIVHGSTDTQTYRLEDLNITVARGYDIVNTDAGSVEGYIEDFRFFGRVIVQSSTYYLEPVRKFPSILKKLNKLHKDDFALNQAILYEAKDAAFQSAFAANVDRIRLGTVDTNMPSAGSHENLTRPVHLPVKPFTFHKFGSPEIVRGRVCEMLLLGDHLLLRDVANGNISQAVAFLLRAADVANLVFRNADFDGDGLADNVGVSVKHLVVLTDADLPQNHVHNLGDETVPIDGRIYLQYVSTYGVLERVCVGAAFTSRRFKARALGLSYTAMGETVSKDAPMVGGICERPLQTGLNFNVLAISVTAEKGTRMPELTISLSLAHELGHSFGSGHDPETGACSDHLMCPISLTGTKLSHYTFSACSRPKIRHVIEQKGFCLVADSNSFCGNGLLEGDEECDCGLPLDCQQRDPCCNPRGTYRQCKVNSKYPCHPSQGPCCLPTCQYRDLSYLGLNCALENRPCPCKGTDSRCSCGLQGECVGNQCHSAECARLGLEECTCLPSAGTACMTCCREPRGECKSAVQLTVQQVSAGNVSVGALRRVTTPHTTRSSTVRVERVCDDAEECVDAVFRVWPSGSLCVARGKLGHCSNLGVCDISRIRGSEFPRFERLVESRASIVWTSSMLLVWFLFLVYICTA